MQAYYSQADFTLYNGDCMEALASLADSSIDIVITSPPYNTCRNGIIAECRGIKEMYGKRYDVFVESKTSDEYAQWTSDLFNEFGRVLKDNRAVLYNFGLGNDSQTSTGNADWFKTICHVCEHTPFTVADLLFWKKKCALPNNMSPNKSTRIVEPVIVFCRKGEIGTFVSNKKIINHFETGQNLYSPFYNIFEARNNDGSNDLNKATYSTEFVDRLINLYCPDGEKSDWTVLDPFNGTGTTGVSAISHGMKYVGMELSEAQCAYTVDRLKKGVQLSLF